MRVCVCVDASRPALFFAPHVLEQAHMCVMVPQKAPLVVAVFSSFFFARVRRRRPDLAAGFKYRRPPARVLATPRHTTIIIDTHTATQ